MVAQMYLCYSYKMGTISSEMRRVVKRMCWPDYSDRNYIKLIICRLLSSELHRAANASPDRKVEHPERRRQGPVSSLGMPVLGGHRTPVRLFALQQTGLRAMRLTHRENPGADKCKCYGTKVPCGQQ